MCNDLRPLSNDDIFLTFDKTRGELSAVRVNREGTLLEKWTTGDELVFTGVRTDNTSSCPSTVKITAITRRQDDDRRVYLIHLRAANPSLYDEPTRISLSPERAFTLYSQPKM